MSPTEKLYYSGVVLVSAISVLLSPFFYVRRGNSTAKVRKPVAWRWIIASYLIIGGVLLALLYVIFFKQ